MPEPLLQVLIFELNLWKKMQKTGMPRLSTPFIGTGTGKDRESIT